MADTAKRLYGPAQLATAAATLYTVPAGATAILRYIRVANMNGSDRLLTMSVGADAAATRIFAAMTIPGAGTLDWSGFIPLAAGEIIQGFSSGATSLTVILSGVEVT